MAQTASKSNQSEKPFSFLFLMGTRPEVIKLAPVIRVSKTSEVVSTFVLHTGQHKELAEEMLNLFQFRPDFSLEVMDPNQTLFSLSSKILARLGPIFHSQKFDMIFVQGDTTSAFLGALAGYYTKTSVAHVEAGLRTFQKNSPFPEEMNRRIIGNLADIHFPPTLLGKQNLLREGVPEKSIIVTGNTIVDALLWAMSVSYSPPEMLQKLFQGNGRIILCTCHRRESFGEPLKRVLNAIKEIAERFDDVEVLFPVHPNPNVQNEVAAKLKHLPRIHLCPPLGYLDFLHAMERSTLVMSDSGGVQEEAPTLKKPVLILRDHTERPEGVESGALKIVGTDFDKILLEASQLLTDPKRYQSMICNPNPYGDGKASERILEASLSFLREK